MNPLFKNTTKYTEKSYQQFVNFHGTKFNFSYNFSTIVMIILMIYCIIYSISQKTFLLTLLFIAMIVLYVFIRIYIPAKKYVQTKTKYENKSSYFTFNFYKFYFEIDKTRVYYFKMHKVFETKDYFYLYLDEDTAFLVSKSGFKIGTPKDFSEFIKKKCMFKYSKEK